MPGLHTGKAALLPCFAIPCLTTSCPLFLYACNCSRPFLPTSRTAPATQAKAAAASHLHQPNNRTRVQPCITECRNWPQPAAIQFTTPQRNRKGSQTVRASMQSIGADRSLLNRSTRVTDCRPGLPPTSYSDKLKHAATCNLPCTLLASVKRTNKSTAVFSLVAILHRGATHAESHRLVSYPAWPLRASPTSPGCSTTTAWPLRACPASPGCCSCSATAAWPLRATASRTSSLARTLCHQSDTTRRTHALQEGCRGLAYVWQPAPDSTPRRH